MSPSIKALFPTLLMAFLLVFLQHFAPSNFWQGWYIQANSFDYYCELVKPVSFFREPISAWSNLIYWYFGWWILLDLKTPLQGSLFTANPWYRIFFGVVFLFMFGGSLFFHASMTSVSIAVDMSGVYAFCLLPVFLSLHRWYNFKTYGRSDVGSSVFVLLTLMLVIGIAGVLGFWEDSFNSIPVLIFALFLNGLLIGLTEWRFSSSSEEKSMVKWVFISLVSFALAAVAWIVDRYRVYCEPEGWLHGHAFWHVFAGVAVFCLFLYFRGERTKSITN